MFKPMRAQNIGNELAHFLVETIFLVMVAKDEQEHVVGQKRRAKDIRQINKHTQTKNSDPYKFRISLFRTLLLNIHRVLSGENGLGGGWGLTCPNLQDTPTLTKSTSSKINKLFVQHMGNRGVSVEHHTLTNTIQLVDGDMNEVSAGQPTCYIKHTRENLLLYVTRFAKTRLIAGELNSGYRRLCGTPVDGPSNAFGLQLLQTRKCVRVTVLSRSIKTVPSNAFKLSEQSP